MAIGQEEIGRRIRIARDEADLTQQQLADQIGIETAQTISRYERGETEVSSKRLRKIAEATRKPLEFFIRVEGDVPAPAPDVAELAARIDGLAEREQEQTRLLRELLRLAQGDGEPPRAANGPS